MAIFVDGHKMQLARTRRASAAADLAVIPLSASVSGSVDQDGGTSADVVAMPEMTSPRLLVGSDRTLAGANISHDVAVTRVFNRALSDAEVFQNFIGTIPSNAVIENIKIV